ncbi:hypothetical protein [Embleya sp. NPDC059237]|uniref:hypothetical protein n=1 Tax=Embleya sp. NPDC059237 TaxID=3346784 RepID=UPI003692259F
MEQVRTRHRGEPILTVTPVAPFGRVFDRAIEAAAALRALPARVWWCHMFACHPFVQERFEAAEVVDMVRYLVGHEGRTVAVSPHLIACTDGDFTWLWIPDEPPVEWLDTRPA